MLKIEHTFIITLLWERERAGSGRETIESRAKLWGPRKHTLCFLSISLSLKPSTSPAYPLTMFFSLLLYCFSSPALSHFATAKGGFLTQVSTLLFWVLIGDAIWRAATRDGQGPAGNNPQHNNSRCSSHTTVFIWLYILLFLLSRGVCYWFMCV